VLSAVEALRRGRLVLLPTETVYGLAADPGQPAAMDRLYAAKRRPADKAVTLMVAEWPAIRAFDVAWSPAAETLARTFWPGPLTLVLPSGSGRLGFRVPDHPVALALLRQFGKPLAVTSANLSGQPPAATAAEALAALGDEVAVALDAGRAPGGVPSTVVRLEGATAEILRPGAIPAAQIQGALEGKAEEG
jgi:L-threonylcarbamoyladenylate synthase